MHFGKEGEDNASAPFFKKLAGPDRAWSQGLRPRHRKPPRCVAAASRLPNTTSSNSKRDVHYSDTRYSPARMCRRSYLLQYTQSMAPETQMERSYDVKCAHTAAPKTFCHAFARLASARRLKRLFPAGPSLKGLFPGMLP